MQRIDLWTQWGRERGGGIEKVASAYIRSVQFSLHTLLCIKEIAGEKLLHKAGSPTWGFVMTEAGGMRGREGG